MRRAAADRPRAPASARASVIALPLSLEIVAGQVLDPRVREVAGAAQDRLALVTGRAALVRGAAHGARERPFDVLQRPTGTVSITSPL